MFSYFILDSFKPEEMVCLTKHGATFSSLNLSRCTYCSSYDEHVCDTIMLETVELISEIDSHRILQEVSEPSSCN